MSLRHKFDEHMKGDSKLLITEATFGFCNLLWIISCSIVRRDGKGRLFDIVKNSFNVTKWSIPTEYRSQMSRSLFRRSEFDKAVGRHEARILRPSTVGAYTRRTRNTPDGTCDLELCAPSLSDRALADTWNTWTPLICMYTSTDSDHLPHSPTDVCHDSFTGDKLYTQS